MRNLIFVFLCTLLITSCTKKEVFKPHDFVGTPKGKEYLSEGLDSLPTYETKMIFKLHDFKLHQKTKDTISATYEVTNMMVGILKTWQQNQTYGGSMLLTLDNTNPDNPTIQISQNIKNNFKTNNDPIPTFVFYGTTTSKIEAPVSDFFKINPQKPNTFSIANKTIEMNFLHKPWIEQKDYFGDEGVFACNAKFGN
ncbi:hypothetical protein [Aureivirga sp. CE67]|uniref:hypothetical protein n=1 Tax=Aureivirga sp. CE67 TaxID=1788983 RepID=UPI0018C96518|nr:hypothetical protein [Aureivirga sp. CE67]